MQTEDPTLQIAPPADPPAAPDTAPADPPADDPSPGTAGPADGSPPEIAPADPEPAGGDDEPPAPELTRPSGRLKIPADTKGHYVVLWARKPLKAENHRPAWEEIAVVKASSPAAAERSQLAEGAPFADFLRSSAAQKPGILLRAVPAMHWPQDATPVRFTRPAPVLEIG